MLPPLVLNKNPHVELWQSFLSPAELQLFDFNKIDFQRSYGYSFVDNTSKLVDDRTSSTNHDPANLAEFIRTRIFQTLDARKELPGLELDHIEKMQITQYESGQFYKPHFDFYNTRGWENTVENDRRATVIVYLNDGFTNGQTSFPELNISVHPVAGMALYWRYDYDPATNAKTLHGGDPVGEGTKYITQAFIRNNTWYIGTEPKKK
jgi:2OG-Fe(II) oxygenase superfamily